MAVRRNLEPGARLGRDDLLIGALLRVPAQAVQAAQRQIIAGLNAAGFADLSEPAHRAAITLMAKPLMVLLEIKQGKRPDLGKILPPPPPPIIEQPAFHHD
jgi:hypothetical protein